MAYSRVEKYKELRDGLKDEAGINREKVVEDVKIDESDDDFLSFIKEDEKSKDKSIDLEDTLTEAKTFEQMRQEGSKELEQALRSAKKGVGKEAQYNTRMDILSKIREPEKVTIKIDAVDEYKTDEFARGMFLNENIDESNVEVEETIADEPKKKMTLMEKLASMSPEEDVKKAQELLQEENQTQAEEVVEEKEKIVEEDILIQTDELTTYEESNMEILDKEENDKINAKKDGKIAKLLDVIIVILVIVLIILFGIIIYQNFF